MLPNITKMHKSIDNRLIQKRLFVSNMLSNLKKTIVKDRLCFF
jgi:hypothetical protein